MRKAYRVDEKHEFVVDHVKQPDGTYKVIAPICPPDPYGKDASAHHRFTSGEICVSGGKEPRTLDNAIALGQYWAQGYSGYCNTGVFKDTGASVRV